MDRITRFPLALLLLFVLPLAACAGDEAAEVDEPTTDEPAAPAQREETTVEVGLSEYEIAMPASVPAGPTTFSITNNGTTEHGFEIEGQGMEQALATALMAGGSATLDVTLEPGSYRVYCPVDGHAEAQGMETRLEVTPAGASTAGM